MKKIAKHLSLTTQTIRNLTSDDLSQVQGGTGTLSGGTSVIRPTGTSVIAPGTTVQSITGGTSIISAGGGH